MKETTVTSDISGKTFKAPPRENSDAGITFIRPSQLTDPELLVEGIYIGALPNNFDDSKSDYKFETADGKTVVINSAGQLAYQMKKVEVGSLVRVEYLGKTEMKKGKNKGKKAHSFEVLIADDEAS